MVQGDKIWDIYMVKFDQILPEVMIDLKEQILRTEFLVQHCWTNRYCLYCM